MRGPQRPSERAIVARPAHRACCCGQPGSWAVTTARGCGADGGDAFRSRPGKSDRAYSSCISPNRRNPFAVAMSASFRLNGSQHDGLDGVRKPHALEASHTLGAGFGVAPEHIDSGLIVGLRHGTASQGNPAVTIPREHSGAMSGRGEMQARGSASRSPTLPPQFHAPVRRCQ